jgi:hypothetical protein
MKDCERFKRSLQNALPYTVRHSIEHTISAFDASHTVLRLMATAVEAAISSAASGTDLHVVAIGSFGRLDGQADISDMDAIYLYDGPSQKRKSIKTQEMICGLVSKNQCFRFDHRRELEAHKFDFEASFAYPVIGTSELTNKTSNNRAIQLITEGRVLRHRDTVDSLRMKLLKGFGYEEVITDLDFTALRAALAQFKDSYCDAVIALKGKHKWDLTNRKILKLFALREFSYLATLFAVAEISLRVAMGIDDKHPPIATLSAPSIIKIASWSSPFGVFAEVLQRQGAAALNEITGVLKAGLTSLPKLDEAFAQQQVAEGNDPVVFRYLRAYIVPILVKHDALIDFLHNPDILASFDKYEPHLTTWIGKPQFQRVFSKRQQMIDALKAFATQLKAILPILENQGLIIHEADAALAEVVSYQLRPAPITV